MKQELATAADPPVGGRTPVIVIGGTGFVGRHLLNAMTATDHNDVTFVVHRSRPAWLQASGVRTASVDLHNPDSLRELLPPGAIVINLLRPDGDEWYAAAIANVLGACEAARVRRYIHTSTIDVFSGSPELHITPASTPAPIARYERAHAHAEHLLIESPMEGDIVILRCGAVFGAGGLNVVSLAHEVRHAAWWKLALRRLLYGERRMHLVSVQRVVEVVLAATHQRVPRHRDIFLLTDDDAAENHFGYLQDRLMTAFGRASLASMPALPPWALATFLRLRGVGNTNSARRFVDPRLSELARPRTTFVLELDSVHRAPACARMNVLLVNISLDARVGGGTAERTRHLALHLAKAGCSCDVIAMTGNSWAREFAAAGVTYAITGRIGGRFPLPLIKPWRTWRSIRRADAIHIMGYWNLLSVIVGLMAWLARKPYVLCPAGEFASVNSPRPVMRLFHELCGKRLIRKASAFIAITAAEQDVIANVARCEKARVWIVPNAVTIPETPEGGAPIAGLPASPYLLFVGRLAPIKGPDLLLDAYLAEPAAQGVPLVFAGADLGMRDVLERAAQASRAAHQIHFLGFVSESERAALYERALMLVIPSRSEAMSLVALEAGSHGVPVLLTETCGFDEVARSGGGKVVPASVEGLRQGLVDMLAMTGELRAMGAALKGLVAEDYSWPAVTQRLMHRLETLDPATEERRPG